MAYANRIWVFDVEHGSMGFLKSESGSMLVIDCGRAKRFSPAAYVHDNELTGTERSRTYPINKFVVTHPHDDHIEDIDRFTEILKPSTIQRRKDYDWDDVQDQSEGDYENLQTYVEFQSTYTSPATDYDWGPMRVEHFGLSVDDAKALNEAKYINNSSIITIVGIGSFKIVFPGDIETDGWQELLSRDDALCSALDGTSVFVTSHHGHNSGYAPEIYEHMGKPWFNLSSIHHGDDNIAPEYSDDDRAKGINVGGTTRRSLTTRNDGSCLMTVSDTGDWTCEFYKLDDNI